jgi:hypothetical protein
MKTCPRCGKETTFWQRTFGGGLCAGCGEKAAQEAAAKQQAAEQEAERQRQEAARAAADLRARRLAHRNKCVVCGSAMLKEGYVPDSGGNVWTGGNRMRFKTGVFEANVLQAIACLSCGHVSFWIFIDELPQLGVLREGRHAGSGSGGPMEGAYWLKAE